MRLHTMIFTLAVLTLSVRSFAYTIRVATWNIEKARTLERISRELRETELGQSDIIAFQEMPSERKQAEELARSFQFDFFHPTRDAVISRFPIVAGGTIQINTETGRKATWADVDIQGGLIRVYSVHLSFKVHNNPFVAKTRGREVEAILSHASPFPGPVIIAGDLNTLGCIFFGQAREPAVKKLRRAGYLDALRSEPVTTQLAGHFFPLGRIDWIWTLGFTVLDAVRGNYAGSDHRWMQAIIDF